MMALFLKCYGLVLYSMNTLLYHGSGFSSTYRYLPSPGIMAQQQYT